MRVAAAILAITALSFFVFPGHTYLQQDTQIYVPILEHQWSGVLSNDLLVQRPHVNFTLYDELTNAVRWVTHLPLRPVLEAEQLVFRALGFAGVFLIAVSLGLSTRDALAVMAVVALGATISGPAVLTVEYEPTPRAFAVPLLLLATGLLLRDRAWLAGFAAACAVLLHAPTTWPILVVVLGAIWMRPRLACALVPIAAAVITLLWIGLAQPVTEAQHLLDSIPPQQEALQRMRAAYNFVSTWWSEWMGQYGLFAALAGLALWRIKARRDHWIVLGGLVACGLLSVPLSYLLLERAGIAAIPQIQPARALLFVTLVAALASSAAGCVMANARRLWEAAAWFGFALLLPVQARFFELPRLRVALVVIGFSLLLAAVGTRTRVLVGLLLPVAMAIPAGIVNSVPVETPDLSAMAEWARVSTSENAVFAFPDAGHSRVPGWFRAVAMRAVYVDWKGGGQVNYLRDFGYEWWKRWQSVMERRRTPADYQALGIDYAVWSRALPRSDGLVYQNPHFFVYRETEKAAHP